MRVVAHRAHEIPERPPLRITTGESVQVGDRNSGWPEFVFVTTSTGSGWVPWRYLTTQGRTALVQHGYDTTELPLAEGQEVTVIDRDDVGGWWWCLDDEGREGWVPVGVLTED